MIYDFITRVVVEETPFHYFRKTQTFTEINDVDNTITDPDFSETSVRDFCIEEKHITVPTCIGNSPVDGTIRTNVGAAILDDDHAVSSDPDDKTWILMCVLRDNATKALSVYAFERVEPANYGDVPSGKTKEMDLKEFSMIAGGSILVLESDFI